MIAMIVAQMPSNFIFWINAMRWKLPAMCELLHRTTRFD